MQPRPPPVGLPNQSHIPFFNPYGVQSFPQNQTMIIPMGTSNLNYVDPVTNQQGVLTNQQRNIQSHENPQRRVEGLSFSLYIGRLSKEFNDEFVQQILNYCGGVKKWKRAKGTFGFAEFTYAEGTLRAYQVLNGLRIKDKKIIVSIESENLKKLKQFETDLKQGLEPLRPGTAPTQGTLSIEDQLEKRNKEALEKINALIKDRGFEPSKASASKSRSPSKDRSKKRSRTRNDKFRVNRSRSRDRRKTEHSAPKTSRDVVKLVPKDPEKTLSTKIDWNLVYEGNLIELKMRKWIAERLKSYLGGQEDQELTNFVVGLLTAKANVKQIKTELVVVLEDDAENFVVKMWRRLIFEVLKVKYKIKDE